MHDTNENQKYFSTSHFYMAAFLFAKGLKLINVDRLANSTRASFVFIDTPQREIFVEAFNFGIEDAPDVMVDTRKLATAIRQLKEKLYQDRF